MRFIVSTSIIFLFSITVACSRDIQSPSSKPTEPGPASSSGDPAPHGQSVGNGGDSLRVLFEQARVNATEIVDRVARQEYQGRLAANSSRDEAAWLVQNRESLLSDLRAGRHIWVEKLPDSCPKHFCACAPSGNRPDIFLSSTECKKDMTVKDAGELLLHEHLHYFPFVGMDEDRADRISNAAYTAWFQSGHPREPHWEKVLPQNMYGIPLSLGRAVWTGEFILVWGREDYIPLTGVGFINVYDPVTDKEFGQATTNHFSHWLKKSDPSIGMQGVWVNQKLLVYPDCPDTNLTEGSGLAFGLNSNPLTLTRGYVGTWASIPSDPTIFGRRGATVLSSGQKMVVWGGSYCSGPDAYKMALDGALYDPATQRWESISTSPYVHSASRATTVILKDKLVVWGGKDENGERINFGAIYDFSTRTWSQMPTENAPTPREKALGIASDHFFFVCGGEGQDVLIRSVGDNVHAYVPSGALYDIEKNKWSPIKTEGTPVPLFFSDASLQSSDLRNSLGVWSGTNFVVVGDDSVGFYDPYRDEWIHADSLLSIRVSPFTRVLWTGFEMLFWDEKNPAYRFMP